MLIEALLLATIDTELQTLWNLNIIGLILATALIISLTFLTLEIIEWLNKLFPKQDDNHLELQYDNNFYEKGLQNWKKMFPAANGKNQSPIDIVESLSTYVECRDDPLKWKNNDSTPVAMRITNTGYTVKLTGHWPLGAEPSITGGVLGKAEYIYKRTVFCWGNFDFEGSEHAINMVHYPLEMQMEHAALNKPDDIVCISYLFKISRYDNLDFEDVLNELSRVYYPGESARIHPFPLCHTHRPFAYKYYSYQGSLTFPPFTENVTWIVYSKPIKISSRQVEKFRALVMDNHDGRKMCSNARPIQRLNDRNVLYFDECL